MNGWLLRGGVGWEMGRGGGGSFIFVDAVMDWCSGYLSWMDGGVLVLVLVSSGLIWTVFHST